jgi:hypothetical protein
MDLSQKASLFRKLSLIFAVLALISLCLAFIPILLCIATTAEFIDLSMALFLGALFLGAAVVLILLSFWFLLKSLELGTKI